jgi:hypothetical protein
VTPPGLRDRRHRDGRTGLAGTRRGTSTTINYVLAIGIVTLLVSVLLIGSASILDDQRQSAVRTQLEGVGNRMAAEIVAVDRLSRSGGDVNVSVDRPDEVGGTGYHVELVSSPAGTCGAPTCLELTAPETDTTVSVPVGNVTPVTVERIGDRWLITSSRSATGARETARADVELNVNPSIGVAREVDTSPPIGRAINIVNEKPLAGFTFTPGTPGVGRQVTFRNDTDDIDGTVTNFSWDFTDNGSFERTGPAENVTNFTYSEPGRYDARLQVTDNDGDTGNATKRIVVSGVVYERDAVAAEYDDPADKPGGVRFNVTNQFTSGSDFDPTVTLEQLTVNPENATSYRLLEGDDGSDGIDTEVLVETSTDTETVEYNNGAGGKTLDTTAGTDIPTSGSLDVELTAGDSAYFQLNEFKDQFEDSINASKETYEMTLKYRVNESGTSELYYYRFTVQPDPVGSTTSAPSPPSSPSSYTLRFNFQTEGAETPSGFIIDTGEAFGSSSQEFTYNGNTYSYGWFEQSSGNPIEAPETRDRDSVDSTRGREWDTLNHMDPSEQPETFEWGTELPNGEYQVHLVTGDPDFTDQETDVRIEGVERDADEPNDGNFQEYNATVTVSDGRLDVTAMSTLDNGKLNFIEIEPVSSTGTGTTVLDSDFEGGLGQWEKFFQGSAHASNRDIGTAAGEGNGGSQAAKLEWVENGGIQTDNTYDTSSAGEITVNYWIDTTNIETDDSEEIRVQYRADDGDWETADTVPPGVDSEARSVSITATDALHGTFKLRFLQNAADASDEVYIDDVTISVSSGGSPSIDTSGLHRTAGGADRRRLGTGTDARSREGVSP